MYMRHYNQSFTLSIQHFFNRKRLLLEATFLIGTYQCNRQKANDCLFLFYNNYQQNKPCFICGLASIAEYKLLCSPSCLSFHI